MANPLGLFDPLLRKEEWLSKDFHLFGWYGVDLLLDVNIWGMGITEPSGSTSDGQSCLFIDYNVLTETSGSTGETEVCGFIDYNVLTETSGATGDSPNGNNAGVVARVEPSGATGDSSTNTYTTLPVITETSGSTGDSSNGIAPINVADTESNAIVGDPQFSNVALLLHMDGSNGSTTFTDTSTNAATITATSATISTAQSKFGGASGYFGATTTSYITLPISSVYCPYAADFTLECWVYMTATGGYGGIFSSQAGYIAVNVFFSPSSTSLNVYLSANGSSWLISAANVVSISLSTWTHIALVRQGGNLYIFVAGVQTTITTALGTTSLYYNSGAAIAIGGDSSGTDNFNGYIDEFRLTIGYARYTSTFTPPSAAFLDYALLNNTLDAETGVNNPMQYAAEPSSGTIPINYLLVAGGGGGSLGGGGAGGLLQGSGYSAQGGVSLPITVGTGGGGITNGTDTVALGFTAVGGGAGGNTGAAGSGGSGGGCYLGGTPGSGTAGQGYGGGSGGSGSGGGGGGAGAAGGSYVTSGVGSNGGAGITSSITGSSVVYASGGGGYGSVTMGTGGTGAGNASSGHNSVENATGYGCGGGADSSWSGGTGHDGIAIISYPTSYGLSTATGTYTQSTDGAGNYVYSFTGSGTITLPSTTADTEDATHGWGVAESEGTGDARYSNVVLLLHMDGVNGSTTITDSEATPKTVTNNNVTLSTSQYKFGAASASFNGSNAWLQYADSTDWQFGSGDWTIEGWCYTTASGVVQSLYYYADTNAATQAIYLYVTATGQPTLFIYGPSSTNAVVQGSAGTITVNTWYYIKATSYSGTLELYVNNTSMGTTANITLNVPVTTPVMRIGGYYDNGATPWYMWQGYLDDWRVTKGYARTGQTMPTAAFPHATITADTVLWQPSMYIQEADGTGDFYFNKVTLLLHFDGTNGSSTFTDSEGTPKTLTSYNSTRISTAQSVFGGASGYFEGTNSWLDYPDSTDWHFGSNDFTIEGWFYINSLSVVQSLIHYGNGSGIPQTNLGLYLFVGTDGSLIFQWFSNLGTYYYGINSAPGAVSVNTWYYVKVLQSATVQQLYLNNTLIGGASFPAMNTPTGTPFLRLGGFYNNGGVPWYMLNGYLDEWRITTGFARVGPTMPSSAYGGTYVSNVSDTDDATIPAGGMNTITESGTGSETEAATFIDYNLITEAGTGADSSTNNFIDYNVITEAGSGSETEAASSLWAVTDTEASGNTVDAQTAAATFVNAITESSGSTLDTVAATAIFLNAITESSGNTADAQTALAIFLSALTEASGNTVDSQTGGALLTSALTELSGSTGDSQTDYSILYALLTEASGNTVDAQTVLANFLSALTEPSGATGDSQTLAFILGSTTITESGSAGDSSASSATNFEIEAANAQDSMSTLAGIQAALIGEAGSAQDTYANTLKTYVLIAEAGSAADSSASLIALVRSITESGLAVDVVGIWTPPTVVAQFTLLRIYKPRNIQRIQTTAQAVALKHVDYIYVLPSKPTIGVLSVSKPILKTSA